MKKRKWILAAIALTLGWNGCTQDDTPEVQEQEIRVAFTTDGIQTRVNTLGTGDVWENGGQIMIEKFVDDYEYQIHC